MHPTRSSVLLEGGANRVPNRAASVEQEPQKKPQADRQHDPKSPRQLSGRRQFNFTIRGLNVG
jgi:hypothetical protein